VLDEPARATLRQAIVTTASRDAALFTSCPDLRGRRLRRCGLSPGGERDPAGALPWVQCRPSAPFVPARWRAFHPQGADSKPAWSQNRTLDESIQVRGSICW
jgi:hypothetical protein